MSAVCSNALELPPATKGCLVSGPSIVTWPWASINPSKDGALVRESLSGEKSVVPQTWFFGRFYHFLDGMLAFSGQLLAVKNIEFQRLKTDRWLMRVISDDLVRGDKSRENAQVGTTENAVSCTSEGHSQLIEFAVHSHYHSTN
jgi:hypothetical protein